MSPPAVPYVATVTATAELKGHPAIDALSPDDKRAWCAPSDAPATLTITFDRPVAVAKVSVEVAEIAEAWSAGDFVVVTDSGSVKAHLELAAGRIDVDLSGAPTKTLALSLEAQSGLPKMCVTGVVPRDADYAPAPLLLGVTAAAAAALPQFVTDLDAGLRTCDAKAIAAAFAFPVVMTMRFDNRPADGAREKKPVALRYASAPQLAAACATDGRLVTLGFAAGFFTELTTLRADGPGHVHLGEEQLGWHLAWKNGWKVSAVDIHDPTYRSDGWGDEPGPVEMWISKLGGRTGGIGAPSERETAADALFIGLDPSSAVLARDRFIAAIGALEDPPIERVTTARSGGAGWMVLDTGGRVSVLTDSIGDASVVIAAFVSSPHSARDKAAAMAPLPPLTRDQTLVANPDVLAAVNKLLTGPLDKVAATRPDLIAFGAGDKDTIIGGDKLAPVWRSRWANQLAITGVIGRVATSGKTALVIIDATKAKTLYRIAMILDQTSSGAWSLGHLHIATP